MRLPAAAAAAWSPNVAKEGKVKQVLQKHTRACPEHEDLRKCIQYIHNRPGQFKYAEAIKKGLPIDAEKVESTNRHLIQARRKCGGAEAVPVIWQTSESSGRMKSGKRSGKLRPLVGVLVVSTALN